MVLCEQRGDSLSFPAFLPLWQSWAWRSRTHHQNILVLLCTRKVRTGNETLKYHSLTGPSNYISELSSLPQNCNAEIESIFSLPGKFHSHEAIEEEEKSTFYFLASIALRRLLNRAHYMLYDREIGLQIDSNNFPSVNQELARQLQDWYQTLSPSLQFPEDGKRADDPHSEYLRQWYLSCRSVIHRPYLEWALSNPTTTCVCSMVAGLLSTLAYSNKGIWSRCRIPSW